MLKTYYQLKDNTTNKKCLRSLTNSFITNSTATTTNLNVIRCRLGLTKQRIVYIGPMQCNMLPECTKVYNESHHRVSST